MNQKHQFYRKEKNHLKKSLLWKEIVCHKNYDFFSWIFHALHYTVLLTV